MMGSEEDPKDGGAVAGAVFGAVFIYIVSCSPSSLPTFQRVILLMRRNCRVSSSSADSRLYCICARADAAR
jgi:hypothetical protein